MVSRFFDTLKGEDGVSGPIGIGEKALGCGGEEAETLGVELVHIRSAHRDREIDQPRTPEQGEVMQHRGARSIQTLAQARQGCSGRT
jgi:hypothetical protein